MKKRIFAILLVISMIAGMLPSMVYAVEPNQARFVFTDSTAATAPAAEVLINQGDPAVHLKTVGKVATTAGASASDYNIKITYNVGENPKLYLKGANIESYGDARGWNAILIGSATASDACNNVSVDIVIEDGDTNLTYKNGYGSPNIKSYITGTLTISNAAGSTGVLKMQTRFTGASHGAIDAVGDVLLKDAKVYMYGYPSGQDNGYYIYSSTGNITVDGGSLEIVTAGGSGSRNVLYTKTTGKNITIQNKANVDITVNKTNTLVFNTAGAVVIKDSTVSVEIVGADSKLSNVAPTIEGYAAGYNAKIDTSDYDQTNLVAALTSNYETCTNFSITPILPPEMKFTFSDSLESSVTAANLVVNIAQGDAPKYYKTVSNVVTATGASETDYNIKVTYNAGENAKLYLKGANIQSYGDGRGINAIMIGSATASDKCNTGSVDIIIENGDTNLTYKNGYGSPNIKSYITGTLTISNAAGSTGVLKMQTRFTGANHGAIDAVGDVLLKDAKVYMYGYPSGQDNGYYIYSSTGSITVDGGSLEIVTAGGAGSRNILYTAAANKDITIQSNANVSITVNKTNTTVFKPAGRLVINNASVSVNILGDGSVLGEAAKAPVIDGYANGYVAKGNDAEYNAANYATYKTFSIAPIVPPKAQVAFANSSSTMGDTIIISEGGAPVYLKTILVGTSGGKEIWAATSDGASATDYNIMVTFPTGDKPTITLKGAKFSLGDGSARAIVIGDAANAANEVNQKDYNIVIAENSSLEHWTSWSNELIKSYTTGNLTITGTAALTLRHYIRRANNGGMIHAVGNVNFVNANVTLNNKVENKDIFASYITSTNGNITVSGGNLTISTERMKEADYLTRGGVVMLNAPNGKITIENSATVNIAVNSDAKAFVASDAQDKGIAINNSTVTVTTTVAGAVFNVAPVIDGYGADGYVAKGDSNEYNAANYATYKTFSIAPYTPPKAQVAFANSSSTMGDTIIISEGGAPVYLKTVNVSGSIWAATTDGASATDYNIMVTFPTGDKPTITLKGAKFSLGDGSARAIVIGDAANAANEVNQKDYNIVIAENSSLEHWTSWSNELIKSYTTGNLTITGTAALTLRHYIRRANNGGMIHAVGNVNFVNANVTLNNKVENKDIFASYITSTNGNITVSGGNLTISTERMKDDTYLTRSGVAMLNAPNGAITINESANVAIAVNSDAKAFVAGNGVTINNSTVMVSGNGTVFGTATAPTFDGYGADGYIAKGDDAAYNAANYATYKTFTIAPFVPPQTVFTFVDAIDKDNAIFTANLAVTIKEGDAPVYLKTVNNVVTATGASATDYNIMITFPTGGKPTLTLKGAAIDSYGDGRGLNAIKIGSATAGALCNDVSVDIVVDEGASRLFYSSGGGWGAPNIKSYITGKLTISSKNGGTLDMQCRFGGSNHGAIDALGDIELKDLNLTMSGYSADPIKGYYIHSIGGNITINGGALTLTTTAVNSNRSIIRTSAAGKNITIENSAQLVIDLKKTNTVALDTQGDVIIKNSTVSVVVTGEGSTIAAKAPVIDASSYVDGYVAKGDDAEYNAANFATYKSFSIQPYEAPKAQFTFAATSSTMGEAVIIEQGGAPVYLKTVHVSTSNGREIWAATTDGASASDYNIMVTFPADGKPTVTLKGAKFSIGDGSANAILIGDATNAASLVNDMDYNIVVAENSSLEHWTSWSNELIKSNTKGNLTITGAGKLTLRHYIYRANKGGIISAVGNVNLVNAQVAMDNKVENKNIYTNYITSTTGNITISGGSLTISTERMKEADYLTRSGLAMLNAPAGKITIENNAIVGITVNSDAKAFKAGNGVTISNSSVNVTTTVAGAVFDSAAPVLTGYANGYIAKGDDAEYKAANYATYKTFSIRPYTIPTAQFTFSDSLDKTNPTANLVVSIKEGDAPVYLKTVDKVVTADGASADDYNIKITFETGKKPTLYLKGANIESYGDARGLNAIKIGTATTTDPCNDNSVDIVIEEGTTNLTYKNSWGDPNIKSYITGTLTITSKDGGVLNMQSRFGGQNHGAIDAIGDIVLKDTTVTMKGTVKNGDMGYYIHSSTGNITIDGGRLDIASAEGKGNRGILWTEGADKNITIKNSAVVNITVNNNVTTAFKTIGKVIVNNSSVSVTINGTDSKISDAAPVIDGYANGYIAKGDGAAYDAAKIATYKTFTVVPYQTPKARFVFKNFQSETPELEYIIEEGGEAIYLRTVGGIVTAEGASADKYNIKITFETGKKPKLYLKGAEIKTYGDGKGDNAITIGSPTATDICNDIDVDIVIQKNSTLSHIKTWGAAHIQSYITGTLTITREKGTLSIYHMGNPSGFNATIEAIGDILFKNANVTIGCGHSGADRYNVIRSSKGNITVNGGNLTINTNSDGSLAEKPTSKRLLRTEAEGKNIVFMNGAKVKLNIKNAAKPFSTLGDVIFDNATVSIIKTGEGTIFETKAPVIKGYLDGYEVLGDDVAYEEAKFDTYKTFYIEANAPIVEDPVEDGGSTDGDDDDNDGSGKPGSPNTGDSTNLGLLITLVVISAFGFVAVLVFGKKKFAAK